MSKVTEFFQWVVIGLLFIGAIVFIFQNHFFQSGIYMGIGILFMLYNLMEKKSQKNSESKKSFL